MVESSHLIEVKTNEKKEKVATSLIKLFPLVRKYKKRNPKGFLYLPMNNTLNL